MRSPTEQEACRFKQAEELKKRLECRAGHPCCEQHQLEYGGYPSKPELGKCQEAGVSCEFWVACVICSRCNLHCHCDSLDQTS